MADLLNEYLSAVTGQMRWKRAVPVVKAELSTHLEEQKEELLAQGLDVQAAESEAVKRMGDPVIVGMELDRVHRPRPQWLPLALAVVLACTGAFVRIYDGADAARTAVGLLGGIAALFVCYFLDYTFFARHACVFCFGTLGLAALSFFLSPQYSGQAYYTSLILPLFPFAYALGVYALHGRHMITALLLAIPFLALCWLTPNVTAIGVFLLCGFVTLLIAARKNWFRTPSRRAVIVLLLLAAAAAAAFGWTMIPGERVHIMLHPEDDMYGAGFQGCTVRALLWASQSLGSGADVAAFDVLNVFDFPFARLAHGWGLLPASLTVLALLVLFALCAVKCIRTKNTLGGIVSMSILVTLAVPAVLSIAANLGYILALPGCPFLAGNLHSIVDLALLGIALSVFRQEKLPERRSFKMHEPRITWENSTLTIRFG